MKKLLKIIKFRCFNAYSYPIRWSRGQFLLGDNMALVRTNEETTARRFGGHFSYLQRKRNNKKDDFFFVTLKDKIQNPVRNEGVGRRRRWLRLTNANGEGETNIDDGGMQKKIADGFENPSDVNGCCFIAAINEDIYRTTS